MQQEHPNGATARATGAQQTGVKALANKVMARNKARNNGATYPAETVQQSGYKKGPFVALDVAPLAAKLRWLGQPIGLEVEGDVVVWIAADTEAAARADVAPCITADEAEVLSHLDAHGIRQMLKIKRAFGGTITPGSGRAYTTEESMMTKMTKEQTQPNTGIPPEKCCLKCQRAAIEGLAEKPEGLSLCVQYCSTTRRALSLRSHYGLIESAELIGPGDRDTILDRAEASMTAWLDAAQAKQAELDRDEHVERGGRLN